MQFVSDLFSLHKDIDKYKIFASDKVLFTTLSFMDKAFTEIVIYEKLLSDKLYTDLGYLYENIVFKMLQDNDENMKGVII